jgi:hypothetical protein
MSNIEEVEPTIKKSYTEAHKQAIYKWRANNKEKIKLWRQNHPEIFKNNNKLWTAKNQDRLKEKWREYSKKRYEYIKECKRLSNNCISSENI